jgi:hypothetical protein
MFAVERINILKSYLRERGKLDVHSMSAMLSVSEVTVRREREEIARVAFLMVQNGDALMLTNGPIAGQAGDRSVLLGGSPDPESSALFGSLARATTEKIMDYASN